MNFSSTLCLTNERYPGFHIGLGEHNQTQERVPWHCPLHLDLILKDCAVYVADELVFSDGHWDHRSLGEAKNDVLEGLLVGDSDNI